MKCGVFNMIPNADDVLKSLQNSRVLITNEVNAHHFLGYEGYCSL
jgi:hypothetical protein